MKILMIDVGGTNVKLMASDQEDVRKFPSGRRMTAAAMVKKTLKATEDWEYEAISLGFPGLVRRGVVARDPYNLGTGWIDFDYEREFGCSVRVINDAAMQALGKYHAGRLLFLGLGTSVGATLIADDAIIPIEIGVMPLSRSEGFLDRMSKEALGSKGQRRWQKSVEHGVKLLHDIFWPDHFHLGGGNAKYLDPVPEGCERGDNRDAFQGALRLWPGENMSAEPQATTWRILRGGTG